MKLLALLLLGLVGCQRPNNAQELHVDSPPIFTSETIKKFLDRLENAVREEDSVQFVELAIFPLEVRGSMDDDRNYIAAEAMAKVYSAFLSQSSGFKSPDTCFDPVRGKSLMVENHSNKIHLLEQIQKIDADKWVSENATSLGSVVIDRTSQGWKVTAIYLDTFEN